MVEYLSNNNGVLTETIYPEAIEMVSWIESMDLLNKKLLFPPSVCNQPVPDAAAVIESQWRRVRPRGRRTDAGDVVAAPTIRLRPVPAVPRVARLPADNRQAIHRPSVCSASVGPVRLGGPARTRLSKNGAPPDLRQVLGAARIHPEANQQRVLPLHL